MLSVGTNVLIAGLGLLSGPLAARLLGPAGRGELAAIQNLFWLAAILAMLGLPESAIFFTARQPGHSGQILSTAIFLSILATPLFFCLMYPFVPLILSAEPESVKHAARLFILAIPLYAVVAVATNSVRGTNKLVYWNLIRLLPGAGWLIFLAAAWIWAIRDPVRISAGYFGVLAVITVPSLWIAGKLIPLSWRPSKILAKPMLGYGIPLAGAAIPQTLNLRLDQILIGAFLPPYQLGLYVVAVAWSSAVFLTPNAIGNVLFPKIASSTESPAERAKTLTQSVRLGILTSGIVAAVLFVLTPYVIPLFFGKAFSAAVPVGFVLILAALICGVNIIFEETLRGLEDTKGVFWGETVGLAATAIALIVLLRPMGIMGAGISSVLGYALTCVVLIYRICSSTGCSLAGLLFPKSSDVRFIAVRLQGWRLILSGQDAK